MPTKSKTLIFKKIKETKNTCKFEEQTPTGEPPIVQTLYVQKWFVGTEEEVKVTVEVGK